MKKVNPWAICHAQLGKEKSKKFERCVMKVKAKHGIKEGIQRRLRVAAALERGMKREVAAGDRPQPKSPKDLTKDELAAARKVKHAAESGMKRARAGGRMAGGTQAAIVQSKRTSKRKESADIARASDAANDSTSYEGPSIAEITQEYIRKARDADIGRHKKKYDTLKSISKEGSSTRGYAAGRFVTKQDATWKKGKKLLAVNKRRTAEREAAKKK